MNSRLNTSIAAAFALFACAQSANAIPNGCPIEGATPMNIGPINPQNGFPLSVQDSNGLAVEMCLDPNLCISDPVIPGNVFSEQIGFGAEGFWASADARLTTSAGINARLIIGVEAAFLTETPKDGDQFPFTRLRIRIDIPQAGIYTVTHPWGREVYTIETPDRRAVNESFDFSFAANSVHQGRIGPILQWDSQLPIIDAQGGQYIGNPAIPHTVTGSPCGTNFFRIEAVALDGVTPLNIDPGDSDGIGGTSSVQTNLFTVSGKIFTQIEPAALVTTRTTYARQANSAGQVDIFATSDAAANVTVSGGANLPAGENPLTGDGNGLFYSSLLLEDAAILPRVVSVTANSSGKTPTRLLSLLTDKVDITRAEYNLQLKTMTIEAVSSDLLNPPTLTAFGFGNLSNGSLTVPDITAAPSKVRVISTAGGSDIENVTIVGAVQPVAVNDAYSTPQNTVLEIPAPGVLGNDINPDGTALTAVLAANVSKGTLALNPDGSFTYTPNTGFIGQDSFTYTVQGGNSSGPATVTIDVIGSNAAPVAVDDEATTAEDTPANIAVLANDSDADGNTLTLTSVNPPVNGTAAVNPDNTVSYTPNANFNGTDAFTYSISDGNLTATATITVTVTAVNDNPVAANDAATTAAGTPVTVSVLGNDSDIDGDNLIVAAIASSPANGTVSFNANSVTYTPNAGFTGTDAFQYTVSDGSLTATATVTITVNSVAVTDQVTVITADFRTSGIRWSSRGTSGANTTVTIHLGSSETGTVVGTAEADQRGRWRFESRDGVPLGNNTTITVVSSGGGKITVPVTVRR